MNMKYDYMQAIHMASCIKWWYNLEFLFSLTKQLDFMQTIKIHLLKFTTANFFLNTLHADCAPATDLDLPPTLGSWVEGQSG